MRPDRIIVGECRGAEAVDMLQAMNTGHDGSLTTIHANSPRDALARTETLVLTAGFDLPLKAIRDQISSAFDLIIHTQRLVDGRRRITHITEVGGMEGEIITLSDIFVASFVDDAEGDMTSSKMRYTRVRPTFIDKLQQHGVTLPKSFFTGESAGTVDVLRRGGEQRPSARTRRSA
jgi:pilus assembly protein CpaF